MSFLTSNETSNCAILVGFVKKSFQLKAYESGEKSKFVQCAENVKNLQKLNCSCTNFST